MTRRRVTVMLLAAVQVLVLAGASLAAVDRWFALPLDDGPYVLLVMGSDMGPPRPGPATHGRADGIHVVVVTEDRAHVTIVSIPRDAWVPVRGHGMDKLNSMLVDGPDNAVGTISDLTGLAVDDWVVTAFDAMILGIDEFGGVHVDVEQRLHDNKAETDLQPGMQRLTGWKALGYARDRNSRPDGDVGRSTGQGKLLASLHREFVADTTSPARLVDFASMFRRYTASSIPADRLFRLGVTALRVDPTNVTLVTVPGSTGRVGNASVYELSGDAFDLFADLRDDGRLTPPESEG